MTTSGADFPHPYKPPTASANETPTSRRGLAICTRYASETSSKARPAANRKRGEESIMLESFWNDGNRCG